MAAAADVGADAMPDPAGSTFGLMTLGSTGSETDPAGGGVSGIVGRLVDRGRPVRGWVLETRPLEDEAHATARALAASGADTTVVADATAGWLMASRSVDAVVIGADRIASDGAVTSVIGTYGLAALARRHGVPCFAVATTSAIDLRTRDPDDPGTEFEPFAVVDPADPTSARVASTVGTRGPLQDITPADLLTAIVTEQGVLRPPYEETIAGALDHEAAASA
jgi:methylthioribose-1-phosphate isomerase